MSYTDSYIREVPEITLSKIDNISNSLMMCKLGNFTCHTTQNDNQCLPIHETLTGSHLPVSKHVTSISVLPSGNWKL